LSQETRALTLLYGEKNPKSLSHLGLSRYRIVGDSRTEKNRITIANNEHVHSPKKQKLTAKDRYVQIKNTAYLLKSSVVK